MRVVAFGALLVVWGNLTQWLIGDTAVLPGGSWQFVVTGAVLVALSLALARWLGLAASDLGLTRSGAIGGLAIGAVIGAVIALVDVAASRLAPLVLGAPLVYGPLYEVSGGELARHVAVFLPLGAVIPEEFAFRGTLLGAMVRRWGVAAAVTGSAMTFALWHEVVVLVTVANTNFSQTPDWWLVGLVGALIVLFVGGVIMALLRIVSGNLTTPIAAHWAFNAVILAGLWAATVKG